MSIESNVQESDAAKALYRTIGEILLPKVAKLPSDRSREIFWRLMLESVQKRIPQAPVSLAPLPPYETPPDAIGREALLIINDIRDLAPDVCTAGADFADSVLEKAESIAEAVERLGYATDRQLTALENMLEGLRKWLHD